MDSTNKLSDFPSGRDILRQVFETRRFVTSSKNEAFFAKLVLLAVLRSSDQDEDGATLPDIATTESAPLWHVVPKTESIHELANADNRITRIIRSDVVARVCFDVLTNLGLLTDNAPSTLNIPNDPTDTFPTEGGPVVQLLHANIASIPDLIPGKVSVGSKTYDALTPAGNRRWGVSGWVHPEFRNIWKPTAAAEGRVLSFFCSPQFLSAGSGIVMSCTMTEEGAEYYPSEPIEGGLLKHSLAQYRKFQREHLVATAASELSSYIDICLGSSLEQDNKLLETGEASALFVLLQLRGFSLRDVRAYTRLIRKQIPKYSHWLARALAKEMFEDRRVQQRNYELAAEHLNNLYTPLASALESFRIAQDNLHQISRGFDTPQTYLMQRWRDLAPFFEEGQPLLFRLPKQEVTFRTILVRHTLDYRPEELSWLFLAVVQILFRQRPMSGTPNTIEVSSVKFLDAFGPLVNEVRNYCGEATSRKPSEGFWKTFLPEAFGLPGNSTPTPGGREMMQRLVRLKRDVLDIHKPERAQDVLPLSSLSFYSHLLTMGDIKNKTLLCAKTNPFVTTAALLQFLWAFFEKERLGRDERQTRQIVVSHRETAKDNIACFTLYGEGRKEPWIGDGSAESLESVRDNLEQLRWRSPREHYSGNFLSPFFELFRQKRPDFGHVIVVVMEPVSLAIRFSRVVGESVSDDFELRFCESKLEIQSTKGRVR